MRTYLRGCPIYQVRYGGSSRLGAPQWHGPQPCPTLMVAKDVGPTPLSPVGLFLMGEWQTGLSCLAKGPRQAEMAVRAQSARDRMALRGHLPLNRSRGGWSRVPGSQRPGGVG